MAALTSLCPIVFMTAGRFLVLVSTREPKSCRVQYMTRDARGVRPLVVQHETASLYLSGGRISTAWTERASLHAFGQPELAEFPKPDRSSESFFCRAEFYCLVRR